MSITINNFYIKTKGVFKEISEIPSNFKLIFNSKSSKYFVDEQNKMLIRVSNHWGSDIKQCKWFLDGYPQLKCNTWVKYFNKKFHMGIIEFNKLELI